jgi:pimeloyl-ACP methyl ester carboxylesterase
MQFQSDFDYSFDPRHNLAFLDPAGDSKPVVLLLHGLGADAESWFYQFPALISAGYRPIAPDIPGFGRSKGYPRRWSVKHTARILADWLTQSGIEQFCLVGHSMGGVVAQELALACEKRIEKLILVNTFAHLRLRFFREARYLIRRFITLNLKGLDEQAVQVAERVFPHPSQAEWRKLAIEKISQSDPKVYKQAMMSLAIFDARRQLHKLKMPALVISGEGDSTVALPIQTEMVKAMPDARQLVIQNAGHAVFLDQPQVFNQALINFLGEQ